MTDKKEPKNPEETEKKPTEKKTSLINFKNVSGDTDKDNQDLAAKAVKNELDRFYQKEIKVPKKQVSIYLDEDVIKALNKWGKGYGKGAKSDLVNNFLKEMFNIRQGD